MLVQLYWPLALGLVLVAGLSGWVFIHSNRSYLLRWALIPLALVVATASARMYDAGLGYAVPGKLPDKFLYLGHQVVIANNRKTGIEVWVRTAGTRLYRIPYSKPAEEAMDRAREQARDGQPVLMRRMSGAGEALPRGASDTDARYESKLVLPSDVDPKT
jgi:hypothetical protein